jgi:hypothetical protein
MTIEECLDIAYSWNMDILSFRTTAGRDRLRAAILTLVAQARDEEAEACASLCAKERVLEGDAHQCERNIRARIAARAEGGKHE